jgi:hypothetical protein
VYLSTTAGTFEDAATTGGTRKLGVVLPDKGAITGTRIRFFSCQGR